MRSRPSSASVSLLLAIGAVVALVSFAGCSSTGGAPVASRLASPWTVPAFATREIVGTPAAVRAAAAAALEELGFAGARAEGGLGRLSAQRRQSAGAEGARQLTFDATLTLVAPGRVRVEARFQELVEAADGAPSGGLVRSQPLYDAFFERLSAALVTP